MTRRPENDVFQVVTRAVIMVLVFLVAMWIGGTLQRNADQRQAHVSNCKDVAKMSHEAEMQQSAGEE